MMADLTFESSASPLPVQIVTGGDGAAGVPLTSPSSCHTGRSLLGRVQGRGSEIIRHSK